MQVEPTGEFWTLDPVDGTKGFLRGDQYAVALAFIRDGRSSGRCVGLPRTWCRHLKPDKGGPGTVVVARRESGCFASSLTDEQAEWTKLSRVDTKRSDCGADVAIRRKGSHQYRRHRRTGHVLGITADPVPMDSQAKYAVLAAGGGDVNLRLLSPSQPDYREKIWDQAAGSICVEEAGRQSD